MLKYSFTFGGHDMRADFGVWMVAHDVFLPQLRPRKVTIPDRNGTYDYGGNKYNERIITLDCDTRTGKSRAEMREIAYILSEKNRLSFWDEPDKYYIGRIYDANELLGLGEIIYKFKLAFICEPFAIGATKQVDFNKNICMPDYAGTADTPTRIQIKNTGDQPVTGIKITTTERRTIY